MLLIYILRLLWLVDTSVLSKICIIFILLLICDFMLPIINTLVTPKEWYFFRYIFLEIFVSNIFFRSSENEMKFQNFCKQYAVLWYKVSSTYKAYLHMKKTNTKIFYASLLTLLLIVAWIGSIVHNLLLTYLITLVIILYPGISKQQIFKQYLLDISLRITSFLPKSDKSKE